MTTINTIEDQNEPPALIIVDNFSMCVPGVDQNKQEQVAPILRLLNALASEYNTHIMVIHHYRLPDKK
jgi:RecA-family ATPase